LRNSHLQIIRQLTLSIPTNPTNQDYSDTWLGLNRAGLGWVHGQKVDGGGYEGRGWI